ncbi:uncharacterized protein K444DRAFT_416939 [Hyaloscypha bicolor E]|uniref:Rhodopsin domain-containing protein n=1 Tax=Hyaloscypha bicolor E TaxID=1095630 RepID=A0A2J6T738_9HELO|nr:uncharacterized protein K444DRAFT_416939 [Hyaloscypha bicolor E]PMD58839.1 hypothetical protein K444DRAFT_416939 [Hyaloscypha bicolor E]
MHMWDIPVANSPVILKWSVTQGVFFGLSILFAKLSILQFYLRLSPHPYFRITVHTLSVTITLYSLVCSFQFLFACRPMAKYWDYSIQYGSCIDSVIIWIFNSVMNSITDITMIFLPILMMWNLQISRRQKIAVNCIFLLGGFVSIVSIIRLVYIVMLLYIKSDTTWSAVQSGIWAVIELYVAIICACLPHTKPFFMHHFPKLLRSSTTLPFSTAHPYSNTQRYSNSQAFSRGNRSEANDEDELDTCKDISLRVLVTGGKTATPSITDTESQKAILGDDGIFVRSEVHVGEESARRDIP